MKKRILSALMALSLPFCVIQAAHAEIFEWQSNNIQLLHGGDFEFSDEKKQTTFTFEHADGWMYGDNFFYIDIPLNSTEEINAEWSPRLSLSKITGSSLSAGPVQDVLLSGTWEKGRNFDAYLYGIGVDLNVPGFNLFQTNWYRRDNPDANGHGWQTTWVWSRPFSVGQTKLTFDGYFDYADYEEGTNNFFTQPQLLLDAGHLFGLAEEGKLWTGIEYRYWHNKYGVDGVNETAPQIMAKWVF